MRRWLLQVRPESKVLTLCAVMVAVVAADRTVWWAQLVDLALIGFCLLLVGADWTLVRVALVVQAPVWLFAATTALVSPRTGWAVALALVARAGAGALAALCLARSTAPHEIVEGLRRLRLPDQLVTILSFMVRYLDLVADQWRRMTIARSSRGFVARGPRDWMVLARSLGTLFIGCYGRGERVHLAMLSRGWSGAMPALPASRGPVGWQLAALPVAVGMVAVASRVAA